MRYVFTVLVLFFLGNVCGQTPGSSLRQKKWIANAAPQRLDSLNIDRSTLRVFTRDGQRLETPAYSLTLNDSIRFSTNLTGDTLLLEYRVLPFDLNATYRRIDTTKTEIDSSEAIIGIAYNPYAAEDDPLRVDGLNYNGSFARGLSFGNSQSLVLNSNFNLQMAGELGEGVEVLAAISDNSIPLQPEGNTAQLNEFDKIFVQLRKDRSQLIAGDYELARPESYFMNYYKKLQGATVSHSRDILKNAELTTNASAAVSRGKFARNQFDAEEGNQGPYQLTGAEGERFIIVQANSERVYIDGVLLRRGLDADYVIDYNRGDVTFTQRVLITKDSRITVDFEYATVSYTRSLVASNTYLKADKFDLHLNIYSEQDSRQPLDDEFSELEVQTLRDAGDRSTDAVISSLRNVEEFDPLRVLYALVDTVTCTGFDSILVVSNDPQVAIYSARFSPVGQGNGRYVLETEIATNGRSFRYVGYDQFCQPAGTHEPIIQLVAPQIQQLFTLGGDYQTGRNGKLSAEVALSNNDRNRLSPLDDGDDAGIATYLGYEHRFELDSAGKWQLDTRAGYEMTQDRFQPLNPYRNAEFTRDWNIGNDAPATTEHIGLGEVRLRHQRAGTLSYGFNGFVRDSFYSGDKHLARYQLKQRGYEVDLIFNQLNAAGTVERSTFDRPRALVTVPVFRDSTGNRFWKVGGYFEREKNERYDLIAPEVFADTLRANSFFYDRYRFFVESPQSESFTATAGYSQRVDYAPVGSAFERSTLADELSVSGSWDRRSKSRLGWTMTYRELQIEDETLSNQDPTETYLGRVDYTVNLAKGAIRSATVYEIGSGQERKLEVTYLQVNPGEGTHQWRDYNMDNVPQLNEFEIAVFQDSARYVRSSIFTDEFVRSDNVQLNQSLNIDPRAVWYQNPKRWKAFVARMSSQTSLQILRKVTQADFIQPWNPFQLNVADTSLVAANIGIRQVFFFNRGNPDFDLQYSLSDNQNRQVLTQGFESRRNQEQLVKGRWNVTRVLSLATEASRRKQFSDSEAFDNRRFNIRSERIEPSVSWQPSGSFRASVSFRYQVSQNTLPDADERAFIRDGSLEVTYNRSGKMSVRTNVSLVDIDYRGQANSPAGFAILQGLQNGQNYLWNVLVERQLAKNLRLSLNYEGRRTGTARTVHTGRAQVAATF